MWGDTTDCHLHSRDALECNRHWGGRRTSYNRRRPADTFCFRFSCQPTQLTDVAAATATALRLVLVRFFLFLFHPHASAALFVRPSLSGFSLCYYTCGLAFHFDDERTRVSAQLSQGHVSRRALIALPISTRARSRTTLLTIGTGETRDQLGTFQPLRRH